MCKSLESSKQRSYSSSGFSLMEVLVTLLILAIVGLQAQPSLAALKASFDRNNAKNSFEYDLRRARSEALSKGVRIIITVATDRKSYTVGSDVLPYDTTNGNHDSLLFTSNLPSNITLSFSGSGADANKLIFSSRGFLSDIAGNRSTFQRTAAMSYKGASFVNATLFPVGVAQFSS